MIIMMDAHLMCLRWRKFSSFLQILLLLILILTYVGLYAEESRAQANIILTNKDEKIIKEMVSWVVEEGDVYFCSAPDADELKKRIEKFFTGQLAKEIFNDGLRYIGRGTGFDDLKVKSLRLTKRKNTVIVFAKYNVEFEGNGSGQGTAICYLKFTNNGWRIYKQKYQ